MTDPDLVAKKLAFIETCVRELREIARPAEIGRDVREERFVEHTLQIAIQAALDVAAHVVSDERLGEPASNRELFSQLARAAWLEEALARPSGGASRRVAPHRAQVPTPESRPSEIQNRRALIRRTKSSSARPTTAEYVRSPASRVARSSGWLASGGQLCTVNLVTVPARVRSAASL